MSNSLQRFFDSCLPWVRWLVVPTCVLCGAREQHDGLCTDCEARLPVLGKHCPSCAVPRPTGERCGRCLSEPPWFDRVIAAYTYEFPVTALIRRLKYHASLVCARPLAHGLAAALDREPYPDLVIAMPLAPARLAERGFNQAAEIARLVGAEFGLQVADHVCRRARDGSAQALLPWKQRAGNVRNAFSSEIDLSGKSVAVVDDVLTTGATLNELARTLKRRGAREVTGWIAARTPAPGDLSR